MVQTKVVQKEISNVQYAACMNPTAGSFSITPRMQRHFATFAVPMPSADSLKYAVTQSALPGQPCKSHAWHDV